MKKVVKKKQLVVGEVVEGTSLRLLGRAPRESDNDRNAQGWFQCLACNDIKRIRQDSVKNGKSESCGCIGREQYMKHWKEEARNLDPAIRAEIFRRHARHLFYPKQTWKKGQKSSSEVYCSTDQIALSMKLPKDLVDFAYRRHLEIIKDLAAQGDSAPRALTRLERRWLENFERRERKRLDWLRLHKEEVEQEADAKRQYEESNWRERLSRAEVHWRREEERLKQNEPLTRLTEELYRRKVEEFPDDVWEAMDTEDRAVTTLQLTSEAHYEACVELWGPDFHRTLEEIQPTLEDRLCELAYREVNKWTPGWRPASVRAEKAAEN
jgi:hypothetical protein